MIIGDEAEEYGWSRSDFLSESFSPALYERVIDLIDCRPNKGLFADALSKALGFPKDQSLTGPFCSLEEFRGLFRLLRLKGEDSEFAQFAFKELLSYKGVADFISRTPRVWGPLSSEAADNGCIWALEYLHERCRADPKRLDGRHFGKPPIYAAAENRDFAMIRYLVGTLGCMPDARYERAKDRALTRVLRADGSLDGDYEILKYMLSKGADPNLTGLNSQTPLMMAVQRGSMRMTDLLTEWGAAETINLQDDMGMTALHYAAKLGAPALFAPLLLSGADSDITDSNGLSALDYARAAGCEDEFRDTEKRITEGLTAMNFARETDEEMFIRDGREQ